MKSTGKRNKTISILNRILIAIVLCIAVLCGVVAILLFRQSRYLDLSVHAAGKNQIGVLRNKDGSIYYPCRSCHAAGAEGTVYVTDYGTNYHASAGCSKLKRVVYRIRKEQAEGKSPCKKCYEEKTQ